MQQEHLVDLEDAVIAIRQHAGEIALKQTHLGSSTPTGAFWRGSLSGRSADYGIDDDFIRNVASTLKPNASALFVLLRKVPPEKVLAELSCFGGEILCSSLSPEQEARLQSTLSAAAGNQAQPTRSASAWLK